VPLGLDSPPQALFELIPLPAYVFDERTAEMLAVNGAALERYGYSETEFLALSARELRPVEDRALFDHLLAVHRVDQIYRGQLRHMTRSGAVIDVQIVSHHVVFQSRAARFVVVTEMTERNQMAQALIDSQRRLQALFDNALDGILLTDDEGRCVDVNAAACRLMALERHDVVGRSVFDVVPGLDDQSRARWRAFIERGSSAGEYVLAARDGTRKTVEYHAVAHVLPGLHLAIVRDVTERNRLRSAAEEQLRESHRQLRAVAARARARREEDRTRLARELHDQLGQSLAGLKMDVFWLRDRLNGTPPEQLQAKIDSMLFLLDDTINRVRRISADLRPPVLDRLGLVPALEWAAEEFGRRSNIETYVSADIHDVPLDRGRSTAVFRIVQEALTNVASHSQATRVHLRVSCRDGYLRVELGDNGCGMAQPPGRSLGLIGMHERAALLGGTTAIHSDGGGTMVTLTVPIAERRKLPRED
jgi:two-component system, NarL family, sensor histidine kinase UhpB